MKGVFVTQHFSTFTSFIKFTMHTGTNGSKMGPGHFFFHISAHPFCTNVFSFSKFGKKKLKHFFLIFRSLQRFSKEY